MATEAKYRPEHMGDWGRSAVAAEGAYGTDMLPMADGTKIFLRAWQSADAKAPALLLMHGLGAHSGWFIDMGNELHARGLTVYAMDHRGFGRSEGARGHVRRGAIFIDDINAVLDEMQKRQPGAPLFILGHSMGGIFAVHAAAQDATSGRNRLAGVAFMNPWMKTRTQPGLLTQLRVIGGGMFGSRRPWSLAGGPEVMTPSVEATEMLQADTYWVRSESAAFWYQIAIGLLPKVLPLARHVTAPALVMQGEKDLVMVMEGARRLYDSLGSADKTWKTYADLAHDCEFDAERAVLDSDLADWIMRHAS
jgi:alpha-beta hydrolase superfamily lysophospholipase